MKEYIDLIIEEKWMKQDEFSTFIAAIEKLPSPKDINLALLQVNDFINMYKDFFDNNYVRWLKYLLPISIEGTPATASNFA